MPPAPKPAPPKRKRGGQPGNDNAKSHGFYSDTLTEDELARIAAYVSDPNLDDEIFLLRTLIVRIFQRADDATLPQLLAISEQTEKTTGRIAKLLRDKRALSGESADSLTDAVATILDELGAELGLKL